MKLAAVLRFWGFLDLCYVGWQVYLGVKDSRIPFIDEFSDSMNAAVGFGDSFGIVLTGVAGVMALTILISGPLLLIQSRIGAIVSLVQFPFRVTLLIPPTFFFIANVPMSAWVLYLVILTLEVVKVGTVIRWLKSEMRSSH